MAPSTVECIINILKVQPVRDHVLILYIYKKHSIFSIKLKHIYFHINKFMDGLRVDY